MAILTIRRRRSAWKFIWASLVLVGLAAGGYAYYSADGESSLEPTRNTASPSGVAFSHEASQTPEGASILLRRSGLSMKSKPAPESKALEFEIAATSNDSRVRFKAYDLAHDCAMAHVLSESARTDSWLPGRPSEPFDASACGDLKPGQWEDVERRHALLREPSLAGVHGAWFRLWQEGPNGPLRSLPSGPEYQVWEAKAREAALASGDPFVYAQEAQEWHDKDPQRALFATVIYRESLTRRLGGASFERPYFPSGGYGNASGTSYGGVADFASVTFPGVTITGRRSDMPDTLNPTFVINVPAPSPPPSYSDGGGPAPTDPAQQQQCIANCDTKQKMAKDLCDVAAAKAAASATVTAIGVGFAAGAFLTWKAGLLGSLAALVHIS